MAPAGAGLELEDTCPFSIDAAWAVIQFISLNILAHVFTIPPLPGETWTETAYRCFHALIRPTMSASYLSRVPSLAGHMAHFGRQFKSRKTRIMQSAKNASLCGVYEALKSVVGSIGRLLKRLWRELAYGVREDFYPALAAVHAGAVAIVSRNRASNWPEEGHRESGWISLKGRSPRRMLWYNGQRVVEEDRAMAVLVPANVIIEETDIQVPKKSSMTGTAIAIGQLCYSATQLYFQNSQDLHETGLSSPYIIVIPYIVGTFLNLLFNFFIGTYSHIVVLPRDEYASEDTIRCSAPIVVRPTLSITAPESGEGTSAETDGNAAPVYAVRWEWLYKIKTSPMQFNEYWAYTLCCLAGPAIVTCILLPATRLHVTDTTIAISFLLWIYGDSVTFSLLVLGPGLISPVRRRMAMDVLIDMQFGKVKEQDDIKHVGRRDVKLALEIFKSRRTMSHWVCFAFFVWGLRNACAALFQLYSSC